MSLSLTKYVMQRRWKLLATMVLTWLKTIRVSDVQMHETKACHKFIEQRKEQPLCDIVVEINGPGVFMWMSRIRYVVALQWLCHVSQI